MVVLYSIILHQGNSMPQRFCSNKEVLFGLYSSVVLLFILPVLLLDYYHPVLRSFYSSPRSPYWKSRIWSFGPINTCGPIINFMTSGSAVLLFPAVLLLDSSEYLISITASTTNLNIQHKNTWRVYLPDTDETKFFETDTRLRLLVAFIRDRVRDWDPWISWDSRLKPRLYYIRFLCQWRHQW